MEEGRGPFGCIMFQGEVGSDHRKRIFELVGKPERFARPILATPKAQTANVKAKSRIPDLRPLNVKEMAEVARMRGWPAFAGLELLTRAGLLWFGGVFDYADKTPVPAWIILDETRKNAEGRRLDRAEWTFKDGHRSKANALVSGGRGWPVGASQIGSRPFVFLTEGGPDLLAAALVAWWEAIDPEQVALVCMTGAGNAIDPQALPLFAGKHIRIAFHSDESGKGRDAANGWTDQLYSAGASLVDGFGFAGIRLPSGVQCKDLADYATLLDDEKPDPERVFMGFPMLPGIAHKKKGEDHPQGIYSPGLNATV
jgi:hypothetical protein